MLPVIKVKKCNRTYLRVVGFVSNVFGNGYELIIAWVGQVAVGLVVLVLEVICGSLLLPVADQGLSGVVVFMHI